MEGTFHNPKAITPTSPPSLVQLCRRDMLSLVQPCHQELQLFFSDSVDVVMVVLVFEFLSCMLHPTNTAPEGGSLLEATPSKLQLLYLWVEGYPVWTNPSHAK